MNGGGLNNFVSGVFALAIAFLPFLVGFMYLEGLLSFFGTSVQEVGYSEYHIYAAAFSALSQVGLLFWCTVAVPIILLAAGLIAYRLSAIFQRIVDSIASVLSLKGMPIVRGAFLIGIYALLLTIIRPPVYSSGQDSAREMASRAPGLFYILRVGAIEPNCESIYGCSDPLTDSLLFVSQTHYFVLRNRGQNRLLIRLQKDDVIYSANFILHN